MEDYQKRYINERKDLKSKTIRIFLLAILSVLLFSTCLFLVYLTNSYTFAEETEPSGSIEENENAYDEYTSNSYDESKETASEVIERLGIREILLEYFDENLVDLIINAAIVFFAVLIFLTSILLTLRKLRICVSKYGVESDATKEVIKTLKTQLQDTKTGYEEMVSSVNDLKANNEELQKQLKVAIGDNDIILKVLEIAFCNDESLVKRGYATEISNTINDKTEE